MFAKLEINVLVVLQHIFDNEGWGHFFNCLLQNGMNEYTNKYRFLFQKRITKKDDNNEIELDAINEIDILGLALFVHDCNFILHTRRIFSRSMSDFYFS